MTVLSESTPNLWENVREWLAIDGGMRPPLLNEFAAVEAFLRIPNPRIPDCVGLAQSFDARATLRDKRGLNMSTNGYIAPSGGKTIETRLSALLAKNGTLGAYLTHVEFSLLMPLTAANGIVGRALWLHAWLKGGRPCPRSFLRTWYLTSLNAGRQAQVKPQPKKTGAT